MCRLGHGDKSRIDRPISVKEMVLLQKERRQTILETLFFLNRIQASLDPRFSFFVDVYLGKPNTDESQGILVFELSP